MQTICIFASNKNWIMSIYVKPVPTLHGAAADRFNTSADENAASKRASVPFAKQVQKARAILEKSKINK